MALKDQLGTDLDVFFNLDDFAEDAIYTDYQASSSDIVVIADFGKNLDEFQQNQKASAIFTVRADQVAEPKFNETITHNGTEWIIERIAKADDGRTWQLACRKDARAKFN